MEEKFNQLIIEKIENGFILSHQVKDSFDRMRDKKFYVARDEKEVIQITNMSILLMESNYQTNKRMQEREEEYLEDGE